MFKCCVCVSARVNQGRVKAARMCVVVAGGCSAARRRQRRRPSAPAARCTSAPSEHRAWPGLRRQALQMRHWSPSGLATCYQHVQACARPARLPLMPPSTCLHPPCPKRCLENRYQERVEEVNARPGWSCPRCRGDCNCSNCRKASGAERWRWLSLVEQHVCVCGGGGQEGWRRAR